MQNNEKMQLWENTSTPKINLRRPNSSNNSSDTTATTTKAKPSGSTTVPTANEAVLLMSKLSVDAKEWFPSTPTPTIAVPPKHSAQSRLNQFKPNSIPQNAYQDVGQAKYDFEKLQEIIYAVTYDPGQFEEMIDTFMDIFNAYLQDIDLVASVADFIFAHAVNEASFRYNGGRLCFLIEGNCPLFRSHLHALCEKHLQMYKPQQDQGLTLFLAELYINLHYDNVYGRSLYNAINKLLKVGGDDNVKTVCQTLKLSGRSLDHHDKKQMDGVFEALDLLKFSVSNNITNLMDSVCALRQSNWGENSSTPTSASSSNGHWNWIPPIVEKPTFYGPDGEELSMEEQKFLADQCGGDSSYYGDEIDDPDELCDPEPEMDEEIQVAFREFVKMNKR